MFSISMDGSITSACVSFEKILILKDFLTERTRPREPFRGSRLFLQLWIGDRLNLNLLLQIKLLDQT